MLQVGLHLTAPPEYYLWCSEQDGEGLWWTRQYPEEVWVGALQGMVDRWRV